MSYPLPQMLRTGPLYFQRHYYHLLIYVPLVYFFSTKLQLSLLVLKLPENFHLMQTAFNI